MTMQSMPAPTETDRLRSLLRQAYAGLAPADPCNCWVYEGDDGPEYSLLLVGWLTIVAEELGLTGQPEAAASSPGTRSPRP